MRSILGKKLSKHYAIKSSGKKNPDPIRAESVTHHGDEKVAVSLRYFQNNHECLSSWTKEELKAFSSWAVKVAQKTEPQITSNTQTCHAHMGKTKLLPTQVSPDVKMYNIDVGKKARVHGFFGGRDFFLVWLDRAHKVLK